MQALISDAYRALNQQLHAEREDYGKGGHQWAKQVEAVAGMLNSTSILDYGAGKGSLAKALSGLPVREYDPAVPGKDAPPSPADIVVCTDVLEHVEPESLNAVLDHLHQLANKVVVIALHTRAAGKTLPDGRNAHLSQHPPRWWIAELNNRWDIVQFQVVGAWAFFIGRKEGA